MQSHRSLLSARFTRRRPITSRQTSQLRVKVRGRDEEDEQPDKCKEWKGGIRLLEDFFSSFPPPWSALATVPDQLKVYWSGLNPMWVFGPMSGLCCRTKRGKSHRLAIPAKLCPLAVQWRSTICSQVDGSINSQSCNFFSSLQSCLSSSK